MKKQVIHEISQEKPYSQEDAIERLSIIRREYSECKAKLKNINEAETRLLIIDQVLYMLGWLMSDFNPETISGTSGYTDYLLKTDNVPRLVLEAKRVSQTFGNTHKNYTKLNYQLKQIRTMYGPGLTEVIQQAERYSNYHKVPYAIVTNGEEWVLVQLRKVPGFQSIEEEKAVYFGNIFSDNFNFTTFWNLLNKNNISNGSLEEYFAVLNFEMSDYSSAPNEILGELSWKRNNPDEYIDEFYNEFFDEITNSNRKQMLKRCFVSNSRLDHYQGELQRTLNDSVPAFIEDGTDIEPEEGTKKIIEESIEAKGRVLIITGSVGCGKSTMISKVLLDIREPKKSQQKPLDIIPIKIDLINEMATDFEIIENKLWEYIREEWLKLNSEASKYNILKKIFGDQLKILRQGPKSNYYIKNPSEYEKDEAILLDDLLKKNENYFTKCWKYYTSKGKGIVVFFDNVDRAPEDFQKFCYSFAHKLADKTGVTVILTMREFTFFRGEQGGFLDIRLNNKVLHLKAPDLAQILSRRIKYVKNNIEEDPRYKKWSQKANWNYIFEKYKNHADVLKETFLNSKESDESLSLLNSISMHDVRDFFNNLFQIHNKLGSEEVLWRIDEIIAALVTVNHKGYKPDKIGNIFKPPFNNYPCYFLKIRILILFIYAIPHSESIQGVKFSKIVSYMINYGYQASWCERAIRDLVRERFLICVDAPSEKEYTKSYEFEKNHSFTQSSLAVVLLEKIIFEHIYISTIGNSLPYHNSTWVNQYTQIINDLFSLLNERNLERHAISLLSDKSIFNIVIKYLDSMYQNELPSKNLSINIHEIQIIEDKLKFIMAKLNELVDLNSDYSKMQKFSKHSQLMIPEINKYFLNNKMIDKTIKLPENLQKISMDFSMQLPLIFCALVILKINNIESAIATEITNIINTYIVDEYNQKSSNNISRFLRSMSSKELKWLKINKLSPKKIIFSLTENWFESWKELFVESELIEEKLSHDLFI